MPADRTLHYDAGSTATFGIRSGHTDAWWNAAYDLSNLLVTEQGRPMSLATLALPRSQRDTIASSLAVRYTFTDRVVPLQGWQKFMGVHGDSVPFLPMVSIVSRDGAKIAANDTEIIVALDARTDDVATWSVYFLGSERMRGRDIAVRITAPSGRVLQAITRIQ
jgi:hypothetical protein